MNEDLVEGIMAVIDLKQQLEEQREINAVLLEALRKIEQMPWPDSESPYALIARAAIAKAEGNVDPD